MTNFKVDKKITSKLPRGQNNVNIAMYGGSFEIPIKGLTFSCLISRIFIFGVKIKDKSRC